MTVELSIKDTRTTLLDYDLWRRHRTPLLRGFFKFQERQRNFTDPRAFDACSFYDLHITRYVDGWRPGAAPPHPGLFEDFFPVILGKLVGPHERLFLRIESSDPEYFDARSVASGILAHRNLAYVFLGQSVGTNTGHLIFEWPVYELEYVVDQWFMSPQVTLEGYIGRESALTQIASLYAREDTEETIRELLTHLEFGFRVWPDNNGLFLLTDKFDVVGLEARLNVTELNQALQNAQGRYLG